MKKKIILLLMVCITCLCLMGCQHKHDTVVIYNKSNTEFDNIRIEIKDGHFYDKHERFKVDENTVGVTIYFSTEEDESWDYIK